ncbi:MAG: DUF6448 family protein [Blastocatellia bacterium]
MFSLRKVLIMLAGLLAILIMPVNLLAHCDALDGPVVKAAQKALETGSVNFVLIWVQKQDEGEVKAAFQKTLAVRNLSPEAKELADRYFFETVVRIHRAGEGAPYTGIKAAGLDIGPAIPAADKALEGGSSDHLLRMLTATMQEGVREHFKHTTSLKNFKKDDIESGREYVKAYVVFIHYVERLYEASKSSTHGHFPEVGQSRTH